MMSFQAYLDNIATKTGKSPDDFRAWADARNYLDGGLLRGEITAGTVVADLKHEFDLGHGHAMAIVALLKGSKHANGARGADTEAKGE